RHRIPLPTHPLNPKHHWLHKPTPQQTPTTHTTTPHPLLDQLLAQSMGLCIFSTEFSSERHWVLSEHRFLDEAIVPGTTYLEMGRAAAELLLERSATEIRDVTFLTPLLVQEGATRTVHTTVRETGDGLVEFTVASLESAHNDWTVHARGTVSVRPLPQPPRGDLTVLRAQCGLETVDAGRFQAEHRVMTFGRRWRDSLRTVHVGVRCALGELALPEEHSTECQDYGLHPALLDLATGFGGFTALDDADAGQRSHAERGFFLPVAYDALRLHSPLPAHGTSFIRLHADYEAGAEVRKADIVIYDEKGAAAVEIRGFTVKRVGDARRTLARLRPHSRHHAIRWAPAPRGHREPLSCHRMLVLGAADSMAVALSAALRGRGHRITEVALAGTWERLSDDRYRVPPTGEGMARLLDALGGVPFEDVVHVAAPTDERIHTDTAELERQLLLGVHCLADLVRRLSQRGPLPARLSVVAPSVNRVTGREDTTDAVHATLFGLAKVVGLENEGVDVGCLDIAEDTSPEAVCDELLDSRRPAALALRGGARYVPELVPVDVTREPRTSPVRPGEVCLITGGLGGLGLAVARHLSRTVPSVRLALVGRTAVPPREQWDRAAERDAGLGRRIEALRELTAAGAEVRTYRGDVTDAAQMRRTVRQIRTELGPISCVVHAAGIAGDGFLFRKDPETFRLTLAPKVVGAQVLDIVTQDAPPRLMVNFGSTVSVFGAAGQSDYTAANSYLDSFADTRTARGRQTVTINWSDWLDVGMAADHGVRHDQGFFRSLSVEDAVSSFEEILTSSCTSVIVGEVNYPKLGRDESLTQLVQRGPLVLSESIREAIDSARRRVQPKEPGPTAVLDRRLRLLGREDGAYSAAEQVLAAIWAEELGLTELNVYDSSLALGVDSLMALRLAQRIQKVTGIALSIADLYRHDTIAGLAQRLDSATA
ncbi:SDR family NAD(P)-dependent oxidoreductase, partial [Streptomyces sp. NPDC017248]|uniref:SDR family NAD(P)-dependent oxidoreductase n=1 Tax=unclassified Streptomyces TaxID=2593676 RepID=UPI0037AAAEF5